MVVARRMHPFRKCFFYLSTSGALLRYSLCTTAPRLKKKNLLTDEFVAGARVAAKPDNRCILIDVDGKRLGVFDQKMARRMGEQRQLRVANLADLEGAVEKPSSALDPTFPVFRFFPGDELHALQMRARELKKEQKVTHEKIVMFKTRNADHDVDVKITRICDLLEKGDRINCVVSYREGESQIADALLKKLTKDVKAKSGKVANIQRSKNDIKFVVFTESDKAAASISDAGSTDETELPAEVKS